MLREPAARSLSQFHHEVRRGREKKSLREAVETEPSLMVGEVERISRGEERRHAPHEIASYVSRSDYAPQLERWFSRFPRDQVLVIRFEDLVGASSSQTLASVFEFLGLTPVRIDLQHSNAGDHQDPDDVEWLWTRTEHCRAGIASLLGMTWERPGGAP